MGKVTLDQVRKIYPNGLEAVQPCSFSVADGEFMVLVGPSGCGKSTLLRMVAGLESLTEGTMHIADRLVNDVDPAERDIAMVFQNYALYPHMTVAKNMGYGLKNRGISKDEIERKVNEAAAMLDLEKYLKSKPSQLSGGQRQRVAMGRAIVRSPELFLFDEPLSNLDAKLRNQMRIEIRSLQRRLGVTSLYVTHDQVEAMTLADRIIVLNGGCIEQIGTPSDIYNRPESTFVASFMGAPAMNILQADAQQNGVHLDGGVFVHSTKPDVVTGKVQLGIRPEDVHLVDDGDMTFEVQIIEELGANRLLHGQLGNQPFSVSVPKDATASIGSVKMSIKPGDMHWFSVDTGKRL